MADTSTKGQGSPNAYFFHVTFHRDTNKWYALEVNGGKRKEFGSEEEALSQVRKWVDEVGAAGNAHVSIHDVHGKIRRTETL